MKVIEIKGAIISNDDKWIYDLFDMEATSPKDIKNQLTGEDVEVEINSPGGSVFAGSEIYTMLKDYKGDVTVKIVGIAASAASVIAMAGDRVMISPTAQLMIHNASVITQGDYKSMDHTSEVLKGINESISNAYKIKSGMTTEELLTMMDNETWITAKNAIALGLVDEIMFENEVPELVASFGGIIPSNVITRVRSERQQKSKELDLYLKI